MARPDTTASELREITAQFNDNFFLIGDAEFSAKPSPSKWSKKEIVGHLCDSAQNNLRRFITGQYEVDPPHVVYDQDSWVSVNQYQAMNKSDLLQLWRLLNERICAVLETMPEANFQKTCNTGKEAVSLRTLDWLASDYVDHLKHHLNQVIPGSFPGHSYPKK
jgi:hypothetical protein